MTEAAAKKLLQLTDRKRIQASLQLRVISFKIGLL